MPDQTSRTLVLNNSQLDQAGEYYVVLSDADNQALQSNPATVTVDPTFIKVTEGALVTDREPSLSSTWWDYDGDGRTIWPLLETVVVMGGKLSSYSPHLLSPISDLPRHHRPGRPVP